VSDTTLSDGDDQSLLPGSAAERAAEDRGGLATIAPEEVPLLPGEVVKHPSPFQYVMIAVVLCVLTGLEVAVSYMVGDIPDGLIVALLLAMMIVKFVLVASWYMHLRTDMKIFRRFFIAGGVLAVIVYTIVLTALHVWD
jgi:cytochrome c oxidase subunit 4